MVPDVSLLLVICHCSLIVVDFVEVVSHGLFLDMREHSLLESDSNSGCVVPMNLDVNGCE